MSRIARAFERRYAELLGEFGARDREKGVQLVLAHARRDSRLRGISESLALAEQNILLLEKLRRFQRRRGEGDVKAAPIVFCDAGLGGLARWLRASGVEAHWVQDIDDGDLVAEARRLGAVIITTDSLLLDRRSITRGEVRAVWVPPSLNRFEQLRLVRAELDLDLAENDSRCMRCGGALEAVNKQAVKSRIPPKTFVWVDDYFECADCGQLFWQGTHWRRINERLREHA